MSTRSLATGRGNVWAFGGQLEVVSGQAEGVPAAFRWNGTAWSQVEVAASLPANMGFTELTGDGGSGFIARESAPASLVEAGG